MARRVAAPVAFVDDSSQQIESAAKDAPHVLRLQLIGCPYAAGAIRRSDAAQGHAGDWSEGRRWLTEALG